MRMAVVGRRGFSLSDKVVDAPELIVGERPMAALRSGRDVSAARPSRSELPAPHPSRPACREGAGDERGPAHESGRNRTYERADRAGIMQAYALLAIVRGAFGAGVSRTWPAMPGRAAPAAVARERGSSLSRAEPSWD